MKMKQQLKFLNIVYLLPVLFIMFILGITIYLMAIVKLYSFTIGAYIVISIFTLYLRLLLDLSKSANRNIKGIEKYIILFVLLLSYIFTSGMFKEIFQDYKNYFLIFTFIYVIFIDDYIKYFSKKFMDFSIEFMKVDNLISKDENV